MDVSVTPLFTCPGASIMITTWVEGCSVSGTLLLKCEAFPSVCITLPSLCIYKGIALEV